MKKKFCMILAAAIMLFCTAPVSAGTNLAGGSTVISTTVTANYTVTIPANTRIDYNSLSTPIGKISVTDAQLEVGKMLVVTAVCNGRMTNRADNSKSIAYTLKSSGTPFTSASFALAGEKELTVDITQAEWNSAAAGDYSDTITFTIGYTDIT